MKKRAIVVIGLLFLFVTLWQLLNFATANLITEFVLRQFVSALLSTICVLFINLELVS